MPTVKIEMVDRVTDVGPRVFMRVVISPTPPHNPDNLSIAQRVALELVEHIRVTYPGEVERPKDGGGQDTP